MKVKYFIYMLHGDVHTGNIDLINNILLRKLMTNDAKFPPSILSILKII